MIKLIFLLLLSSVVYSKENPFDELFPGYEKLSLEKKAKFETLSPEEKKKVILQINKDESWTNKYNEIEEKYLCKKRSYLENNIKAKALKNENPFRTSWNKPLKYQFKTQFEKLDITFGFDKNDRVNRFGTKNAESNFDCDNSIIKK